jgi:hypothetical protein
MNGHLVLLPHMNVDLMLQNGSLLVKQGLNVFPYLIHVIGFSNGIKVAQLAGGHHANQSEMRFLLIIVSGYHRHPERFVSVKAEMQVDVKLSLVWALPIFLGLLEIVPQRLRFGDLEFHAGPALTNPAIG